MMLTLCYWNSNTQDTARAVKNSYSVNIIKNDQVGQTSCRINHTNSFTWKVIYSNKLIWMKLKIWREDIPAQKYSILYIKYVWVRLEQSRAGHQKYSTQIRVQTPTELSCIASSHFSSRTYTVWSLLRFLSS